MAEGNAGEVYVRIQEGGWRLLENMGIRIDVGGLPTAESYWIAYRGLYGANWVQAIWRQLLRPILAPAKHRRAVEDYERIKLAHHQAILDTVIEAGSRSRERWTIEEGNSGEQSSN